MPYLHHNNHKFCSVFNDVVIKRVIDNGSPDSWNLCI